MKENGEQVLLRLRLIVGFLGERDQFGWWKTSFLSPASRSFLDPVFVKTATLASYHGVVEAARLAHDEVLSVGCFHLFRLPEEVEQDLHAIAQSVASDESVAQALRSKVAALELLRHLAVTDDRALQGPTAVGKVKDLGSDTVARAIAGTYYSAFSRNATAYPYLVR